MITYGRVTVATAPATDPAAVGSRVRALREAMGYSLRDLAERTGVSAPMLSQVERGETSPTLSLASRIASGLDLSLSQLLRLDEARPVTIVRRGTGVAGGARSRGHRYEVLTPPIPGQRAEVSLARPRPGRADGGRRRPADARARRARDGRRCSRGGLGCTATAPRTTSRPGDSVTFDSDLPHHFENPGGDAGALRGRGRRRPEKELTVPRTLFDKIWDAHQVAPGLIYIDLHLVHEVTSPQAFESLRLAGRAVRRPDRTLATADHNVPTDGSTTAAQIRDTLSRVQVETLERNCREFGVPVYSIGSSRQGIVHVIGPELGVTQPGMTIVCGDSHTSTHGAFGALAFGIGTSEVEHVLATQTLQQAKPRSMVIRYEGELGFGVTAKDLILGTIGQIGTAGRRRARDRVRRPGDRAALDGGPDDGLQHDDRGAAAARA